MSDDHSAHQRALDAASAREYSRSRRLARRDVLLSIFTPIGLLALWEVSARLGWIDARLFSPPTRILSEGAKMVTSGQLWTNLWPTLVRLMVGFVTGSIAGIIVGLLMGVSRVVRAALGPMFTALYALPKIAILPLLLLIFGLTETPKILSVAISVFFILQINTVAGVLQIDDRILEAARAYRATGWRLFRFVLLPGAVPSIFTGLQVAAGSGVIVITAVEYVASNQGLGFLIWNSWLLFQPAQMYVGLIVVSLLGALLTWAVVLLERAIVPWRRANTLTKKRTK
ncbi:MAG: ABC transporter permease [Propionibacteriaceae bacterium]|nr:ABC transporter permease [Propionibacteriaceae bacterium]